MVVEGESASTSILGEYVEKIVTLEYVTKRALIASTNILSRTNYVISR